MRGWSVAVVVLGALGFIACMPEPSVESMRSRSTVDDVDDAAGTEADAAAPARPQKSAPKAEREDDDDTDEDKDEEDDDDDTPSTKPTFEDVDCVEELEADDDCPSDKSKKLECGSKSAQEEAIKAGCVAERPERSDDEDVCCPKDLEIGSRPERPLRPLGDAGASDPG